jgi:chemotaxis protein methyltransferase CheR
MMLFKKDHAASGHRGPAGVAPGWQALPDRSRPAAAPPASARLAMPTRPGEMSLTEQEFASFQKLIHEVAGISLASSKKALVAGRLAKRLKHHGLDSFAQYYRLIGQSAEERQMAVDLLTTNETYFFREPKHFEHLRDQVLPAQPRERTLRVWSAACSTGEEPYSIAMLLAERLPKQPWEILASDISTRVLDKARSGLYALDGVRGMTTQLLKTHCLKGTGAHEGKFLVDPALQRRVQFSQLNLNAPLPNVGLFDVIFLRNVLIYFDTPTKRAVVSRLQEKLRPDGVFYIGHSESLNGVVQGLRMMAPSIYRKE